MEKLTIILLIILLSFSCSNSENYKGRSRFLRAEELYNEALLYNDEAINEEYLMLRELDIVPFNKGIELKDNEELSSGEESYVMHTSSFWTVDREFRFFISFDLCMQSGEFKFNFVGVNEKANILELIMGERESGGSTFYSVVATDYERYDTPLKHFDLYRVNFTLSRQTGDDSPINYIFDFYIQKTGENLIIRELPVDDVIRSSQ